MSKNQKRTLMNRKRPKGLGTISFQTKGKRQSSGYSYGRPKGKVRRSK